MTVKKLYLLVALATCCLLAGCTPQQTETNQSSQTGQTSQIETTTESQPEIAPEAELLSLDIQSIDSHYVYDQVSYNDGHWLSVLFAHYSYGEGAPSFTLGWDSIQEMLVG